MHVELVKKRWVYAIEMSMVYADKECTLNTAITVGKLLCCTNQIIKSMRAQFSRLDVTQYAVQNCVFF